MGERGEAGGQVFGAAFDAALADLVVHRAVQEVAPAVAARLAEAFGAADVHVRIDATAGAPAVAAGTGRWLDDPPAPDVPGLRTPVTLHGVELGLLTVGPGRLEAEVGPDHAAAMLARFAQLVAVACSTAQLVETERAAHLQQQALVRAGQALSASLVLRDVLGAILSELHAVVPYDTASVQELRGDAMVIVGGAGIDMDIFEGLGFDVRQGRVPNTDVLRTHAPVIVGDIYGDHPYSDFPHEDHARSGVRCWMGVPLLFGSECIGMLTLDSYEPGFYTAAHAEVAMAYAAQAAIALQNARAFEQARRELDERRRAERELRAANRSLQLRMAEIEALQETLREQARLDALTGLFNRRHLMEVLEEELEAARATGRPLSVVMVDVDHFKSVNDTLGHNAGDRVLEAVGRYLRSTVRATDAACRYGGEEFVVVLPGATRDSARRRAETWRRDIEVLASGGPTIPPVTISAGVAQAGPGCTADEVVRAADLALYEAKAAGRNVVVVAD